MQRRDAFQWFDADKTTRGQDCRILRSILNELSSKKDGFPTLFLHKFQLAGYNDNYLRTMTSNSFQKITGCDEQFAKAVELKVLFKIRSESQLSVESYPLPPKADDASAGDIEDAVAFYLSNSEEFTQKSVIDKLFFERNVYIPASTLCRKLRSARMNFEPSKSGRPQILEDWICRDVITPALVQFRAIGRTKWKGLLRMLMKQLVRAQQGIGEVQGILQLVRGKQCADGTDATAEILVDESDVDNQNDDASSDQTEPAADILQDDLDQSDDVVQEGEIFSGRYDADDSMNPSSEQLLLEDMRKRLRQYSFLNLTKVELNEFPTRRTLQRYCKKYKWTQRKIELMAPHRQNGSSPSRIAANYDELLGQYRQHDIVHPNQIIVCDELHWCKEWGDILECIQGICESTSKRSQSDGPARLNDGVTVCPFGSIIGYLYLLQVIVKKSQKLSVKAIVDLMVRNGFAAETILVSHTDSGYQTADSFREAVETLVIRLHANGGRVIDANIKSIRLHRKYLLIADGSSTHPFHDIAFSLLLALAGLFFHQQEPDSTHVCNLYDMYNFLQTKLYSAKEIMMHLAIKFAPRVCNDRQATVWIEETIESLAKTIDISSDTCPHDLSITDEAVLVKFETILKCRDATFDTMHLMECIMPALARGMTSHVTIASAKAVGLLPRGFKITPGYDYAANVESWRGPFVDQVLRQPCVQGQADRELRMERYNANKAAVVQEHMVDFGFDIFRAGMETDNPTAISRNVLNATLATCFDTANLSEANKEHLHLFLNIYEQKKKEEAKRLKDSKSRAAISSVNLRSETSLLEAHAENLEIDSANAAQRFTSAIERVTKKANEAIKQCELLSDRSTKCEQWLTKYSQFLVEGAAGRSVFVATCKRTVSWSLNNFQQAKELWDIASEERRKIPRMCPESEEGRSALTAFQESFEAKTNQMDEFDIDALSQPVVDLAFALKDNEAVDSGWADSIFVNLQ
jgi:hypothetical protein